MDHPDAQVAFRHQLTGKTNIPFELLGRQDEAFGLRRAVDRLRLQPAPDTARRPHFHDNRSGREGPPSPEARARKPLEKETLPVLYRW